MDELSTQPQPQAAATSKFAVDMPSISLEVSGHTQSEPSYNFYSTPTSLLCVHGPFCTRCQIGSESAANATYIAPVA